MDKTLFVFSGFCDVEIVGNQSFKNGIKYLSEFGYKIKLFTFMPSNYPNLQDPAKIFKPTVEFHRLPFFLAPFVNLGKCIKDISGRRRKEFSHQPDTAETLGHALREYNSFGRILYILFLFALYMPVEFLRGFIHSLRQKPALIYGVNWQGWLVAVLLGRLIGRPVITRFFGVSVTEYDLNNWKNRFLMLDEIAGLKAKSDAVVMTNDGTKGDRILRMLNVDEGKVHFWMNGLDIAHLALPSNWNPGSLKKELGLDSKKVVLMISRLSVWKRLDRGIRCVHSLVKKHNVRDVVLLIAGEGPERQRLGELAQQLDVQESILFLGGVPHKEIAGYLSISDIFLSLYDLSNLGNPLLEAIYCGVPVVTINDGSTEHLLQNGYNCLFVDIEDIEEQLPSQVKYLLEDEMLRAKMKRNLKETFDEKVLSWEKRMSLEDKLIRNILHNRGIE